MLIYSMSVSVDGFISDREGAFDWTFPNEEQFRFHIAQTRELGDLLLGRRLAKISSTGRSIRTLASMLITSPPPFPALRGTGG
jgi:dihydrofolate reductase